MDTGNCGNGAFLLGVFCKEKRFGQDFFWIIGLTGFVDGYWRKY